GRRLLPAAGQGCREGSRRRPRGMRQELPRAAETWKAPVRVPLLLWPSSILLNGPRAAPFARPSLLRGMVARHGPCNTDRKSRRAVLDLLGFLQLAHPAPREGCHVEANTERIRVERTDIDLRAFRGHDRRQLGAGPPERRFPARKGRPAVLE